MNTKGIINEQGFPIVNRPGSIAILIDCWKSSEDNATRLYYNIKSFLEREKYISNIVIASYDNYPTDERILSINKNKLITQELDDVQKLITRLSIKHVYMLGASWTYCVKHRPLGFLKVSTIPDIKILTISNCVQELGNEVNFSTEPEWIKLRDKVFLYNN